MSTLASTASALAISLALSAIFAGPALGTAQVFLNSDGRLRVTVDAVSGADGDHGVFVEPFVDVTRNGFRAGQTALGVPPIVASIGVGGAPCLTNPVFNDVVCDGLRGSIAMTMGDGNDRVTLSESGGGGDTCLNISGQPTVPANVALGDGDDRLDVITVSGLLACGGTFDMQIPVTAEGGAGNDSIDGGRLNDTLRGGAGSDTIRGFAGDDILGGGSTEAARPDLLFGGEGRDVLQGGPDRDTLDGGPGLFDTVLYDEKTTPVTVDIGTPPTPSPQGDIGDDGEAGERDEVQTSVENVVGGQAGDTLTGDDDRNVLTGNGGPDRLSGGIGADDLIGNAGGDRLFGEANADLLSGLDGADELVGGPGVDRFFGGADGDVIDARDGLIENQISCGEGATTGRDEDLLTIDLRDAVPADCESVQQFATDDGPPGRALPQRLRARRGDTVAVKLGCPRTARVTCRGVLTLLPPGGGRALARGRYRVRLGGTASVSLTIRRALPRSITAETNERGGSKKGPRFSSRLLRVAG